MNGRKAERLRGLRESQAAIETLRSLWPAAFPDKFRLVKPITSRALADIVERTGWTPAYARGVLQAWKMRSAYCEAVLRENLRVDLNGEPLPETVDERARDDARKQLAVIAARKARQQEKLRAASSSQSNGAAIPR
jgi:sRNA-binding protein